MILANPHFLWLLPCLLAGGWGLLALSGRLARKKLDLFGPPERRDAILSSLDPAAARRKFWAGIAALCLAALALARPMLPPSGTRDARGTGTEFFIILDVSKSMLVRDVAPNRLEAAKASLGDWIKTRTGDRIGLVLAAGDAFVQAPLTHDLTVLRSVLAQSGPLSLSKGGTHLAGAIEAVAAAMQKSGAKNQTAILISDGGATEGQAAEAARKAFAECGLVLHTVGVGTPSGGPVPIPPPRGKTEDFSKPPAGFVNDEYGVRATSRLDERSLRLLASAGGGRYFAFEPGGDTWDRLYAQCLLPRARQLEAKNLKNYRDLFQFPLACALAALLWHAAISNRRKNPARRRMAVTLPDAGAAPVATSMDARRKYSAGKAAIFVLLLSLALQHPSRAEREVLTPARAERWVKEGRAAEAAEALRAAAQKDPQNFYLIYNFGIASYAAGNYADAVAAFSEAALGPDETLNAMALTQLGNAQFRMGQALIKSGNPEGAIVSWENAARYYESASSTGRGDSSARHNLKIAGRDLEATLADRGAFFLKTARANPQLPGRISQLTNALERLEKAAAINPGNKAVKVNIGAARGLLSDDLAKLARENRREAAKLETDPKKEGARMELNSRASQNYARALEFAPDNTELAKEYADFKKSVAGGFAEAAQALLAEARTPGTEKSEDANFAKKEKLLNQSIESAEKGAAFDPGNPRAESILADARQELENLLETRGGISENQGDTASAKAAALDKEAGATDNPATAQTRQNEAAGYAQLAASQYGRAAEDYRKALDLAPGDEALQNRIAALEEKLAASLSLSAQGEIAKADNAEIQDAIGNLEKAVAMLDQAEALDPGKNNAGALAEKANTKLAGLRAELDRELAGQQADHQQAGKPLPGQGKADGAPADQQRNSAESSPATVEPGSPLNFSEIRLDSNEKQGQFVDKTKKEKIRDW